MEIDEVIKYGLPAGKGLDLGCGDGHLMAIILGHVGRRALDGLDIDPHEKAPARGRDTHRKGATAPTDHLRFSDNQSVFSNSVLERGHGIDGVLREVRRVLRPCGGFFFTVPGADAQRCLKDPRCRGGQEAYFRDIDARRCHLSYWDARQWSWHLQRAGITLHHRHGDLTAAQVHRRESIARNTRGVLFRLPGRRKQPIEIQWQMGIRGLRLRFARFLAVLSARVLDVGTRLGRSFCGCLLVEARKPES